MRRSYSNRFEPKGLSIAPKTLANFLERKTQLYEQGADARRIGQYVRNWCGEKASVYIFFTFITPITTLAMYSGISP